MTMVSSEFIMEKAGDETYYFSRSILPGKNLFQRAWLLPPYDEYIMGYKNRDAIFVNRGKLNHGLSLPFDNTIIIDGQVAGAWRRKIQKNVMELEYYLFHPSNKKQLGLLKQGIKKFSQFMDLPVTIANKKM